MDRKKLLACFILSLMLLLATEEKVRVEAGFCWVKLPTFKWICLLKTQCVMACNKVGYRDGKCMGIPHKCFCQVPC
ncbi:hypothetical protein H6P81_019149 [Aristolochia fimbriata]|uniref:Knottins-like domain-containing protein n=1 Tax=Aristolochia fimbriata TaxID=158543 RepID=A0AAV7DSK5_ARIFI|nr:hypothetical protein H6P81_019149 [Aristolochia fimbriata]